MLHAAQNGPPQTIRQPAGQCFHQIPRCPASTSEYTDPTTRNPLPAPEPDIFHTESRFEQSPPARDTHNIKTRPSILRKANNAARDEAIKRLNLGELVALPSDTTYAVYVRSDDPKALARLTALARDAGPPAWHAPSPRRAIETLRPALRAHRRAIRRLLPGPVTIQLAVTENRNLSSVFMSSQTEIQIRVPAHDMLLDILNRVEAPLAAQPLGNIGIAPETELTPESAQTLEDAGVTLAIDDGPTIERTRSTLIRLGDDLSPKIIRPGPMDASAIEARLLRRIVFVCTGNTCRSPMAQAIAHRLIDQETDPIETVVSSAGIAADPGSPATSEAIEAMREIGLDLDAHRSQAMTLDLLHDADVVYTMTESHRRAILSVDPVAPAERLDGEGDIPDPIGGPLSEYRQTAERIADAIKRRLKELDP